jgi:hypothetical protein
MFQQLSHSKNMTGNICSNNYHTKNMTGNIYSNNYYILKYDR